MFDAALTSLIPPLLVLADNTPEDEDVVAGWGGFAVFIGLILAVAVLGWSLTKQLKKVDRAEAAGVYGSDPKKRDESTGDAAGPALRDRGDDPGAEGPEA